MSAPPIGMMSVTPRTKETSTMSQNAARLSAPISHAMQRTRRTDKPMFRAWRCGSMIGLPLMSPLSLAAAMIEPVKVIAPMATPRAISNSEPPLMPPDIADTECRGRGEPRRRDRHRGQADAGVEDGDELRHLRH